MQGADDLADANFGASHFFLLAAHHACRHCGSSTRVFALALPESHQWLYRDDEDEAADEWQSADAPVVLSHLVEVGGAIALRLREAAPGFRPDRSPSSDTFRWLNHCDHCRESIDDHELHGEPEAAFMPLSAGAAGSIQLMEMAEPIQVNAANSAFDAQWLANVLRR